MKTWYVSGPMTGIPSFNFPAFDECRDFLVSLGVEAISPADMDRVRNPNVERSAGFSEGDVDAAGLDYASVLAEDFAAIGKCDGIVLLPGWERSTGAGHEKYVAEALNKDVLYYAPGMFEEGHGILIGYDPYAPSAPVPPPKPVIIGLCGYAQVGKDTVGKILVEEHGFTRISFADALRDMLYALNPLIPTQPDAVGIRPERLADVVGGTATTHGCGWDRAKTEYPEVRELLQRLGTEAGRGVLGDSIWVDTAMKKIGTWQDNKLDPSMVATGRYVFTDVRFPNEVDAVRAAGGLMVRITRPGTEPVNGHASETALDGYDLGEDSLTISNSGTMDSLTFATSLLVNGKLSD